VAGLFLKWSCSRAATDPHSPVSDECRRDAGLAYNETLGLGIPSYVDTFEDTVNEACTAWQTRFYLIGEEGRVVYAGEPGPFGFKSWELDEAIKQHLQED